MTPPVVSVIMPLYNGETFFEEALASVLDQVGVTLDVVLVDDGSSDGTVPIAEAHARRHHAVRLVRQDHAGVTVARNAGVAAARGDFLAFLDQDDRWMPGALATHLDAFAAEPSLGYTVAQQECFLEPGAEAPAWFRLQQLGEAIPGFLPGALVVRRSTFEQLGGFDPHYPVSSDADWFARAQDARVPMKLLPVVTLCRRIHSSNQSSQGEIIHRELFRLLKASIARKRGNS